MKVTSPSNLIQAIAKIHGEHRTPHIIVTSVRFEESSPTLSVVGSSRRSDGTPRAFKIDVPAIDCFFSGTGDMFAALTVVRMREAVNAAELNTSMSWLSPDEVKAQDLPLAKATEKVLASMQMILEKTKVAKDHALADMEGPLGTLEREKDSEKRLHLRKTKATEVRLVRNLKDLRELEVVYRAQGLEI